MNWRDLDRLDVPPGEEFDAVAALATALARLYCRLGNGVAPESPPERVDGAITVKEAAKLTGMSEKWIYEHQRELGAMKVGRSVRLSRNKVQRYLAARQRCG